MMSIDSLRCYGSLACGEEYSWLFLEDSGGEECRWEDHAQRELASRWLAQLHSSAASLTPPLALPPRDSNYYLGELRLARGTILDHHTNPLLDRSDRQTLAAIVRLFDHVEAGWDSISCECAAAPPTLVHGDFHWKNVHVRSESVIVFDWEYCGWGLPAADLPEIDLHVYREATALLWPSLKRAASSDAPRYPVSQAQCSAHAPKGRALTPWPRGRAAAGS
jgi:Phosphotransferase enzyme family